RLVVEGSESSCRGRSSLWGAVAEGLRQEIPGQIDSTVEVLDEIADVLRAVGIQISRALPGVGIEAVVIAIEKVEGHESIEEVFRSTPLQSERPRKSARGLRPARQRLENAKLNGGQQHLGGPEREGGLENVRRR